MSLSVLLLKIKSLVELKYDLPISSLRNFISGIAPTTRKATLTLLAALVLCFTATAQSFPSKSFKTEDFFSSEFGQDVSMDLEDFGVAASGLDFQPAFAAAMGAVSAGGRVSTRGLRVQLSFDNGSFQSSLDFIYQLFGEAQKNRDLSASFLKIWPDSMNFCFDIHHPIEANELYEALQSRFSANFKASVGSPCRKAHLDQF